MNFQILVFFILLGLAAVFDYKKRVIPDFLTCLLWFNLILALNLETIAACSMAFATLWLLNIVFLNLKGREFWGWGDILIFPPFFAQLWLWGLPILATFALIMPMLFGAIRKKQKEEFIAPYLLFFALGALLMKVGLLN